jgi:hypothetical protein
VGLGGRQLAVLRHARLIQSCPVYRGEGRGGFGITTLACAPRARMEGLSTCAPRTDERGLHTSATGEGKGPRSVDQGRNTVQKKVVGYTGEMQ